ncbi:hypothetical protein [Vibrio harveyi]|uniref:hypothetical protein n=1 Tax=Vibrio harveyi TaxID=669 RepID=UPI00186A482A|nr:hypothetical protein [Vibrio harveyi]
MRSDDQVQLTSDTEKGTQTKIAMIEEDKYLVGHKINPVFDVREQIEGISDVTK